MKKLYRNILIILFAVFAAITLFSFTGISVYADEITEETTEQTEETTEGTTEGTTEETSDADEVVNYTFLGRVWEYLTENYAEIISTAGTILAAALAVIVPLFNKKTKTSVETTESKLLTKQSDTVEAVNALIESYNTLTEKYTEVEEELAEYNSEENAKYTAIGSMVTQTKAILEILATVYANSKNLPQGVKDLVSLKYATALKTTSDEEALEEVVEAAEAEAAEG